MRLSLLAAVVALAACGPRAAPRTPVDVEPGSFTLPELDPAWQGPSVDAGQPVAIGGGRSAVLLARRAGDRHQVAVAVGQRAGRAAIVPVATVDVAGSRREVLSSLHVFTLDGERLLRADVRVFENVEPRFFAVRSVMIAAPPGAAPRIVLDRLIESGDDVRDRRAHLAARDVDGDGSQELVVEERESGNPDRRTLIYRRGRDGRFTTAAPSLFAR